MSKYDKMTNEELLAKAFCNYGYAGWGEFKPLWNELLARMSQQPQTYSDHTEEARDTSNELPKIAFCPTCGTGIGIEGENETEAPQAPSVADKKLETMIKLLENVHDAGTKICQITWDALEEIVALDKE